MGIACAALLVAMLSWQTTGLAQTGASTQAPEARIKAAFLYKFAGYVEWPAGRMPGAGTPITIGVMDSDALASELAAITVGRVVNQHPIRVRRVAHGDLLDDLQVLFIGDAGGTRLGARLEPARLLPILTVTESDGAMVEGSIINFTIDQNRVKFEISLAAAEESRLKLSSRLLAVASRVHRAKD